VNRLQGYIQVYTGNGKGKTTAAIGLAIRALGAGKKILFLQFMKSKVYSEHAILVNLSDNLTLETTGKPFFIVKEGMLNKAELAKWGDDIVVFPPGKPPTDYLALMKTGIVRAKEAVTSGQYDIVILDEINVALFFGLISLSDVQDILASKLATVEVVLTGRGAPQEIIDCADLVTEMQEVKHYYAKGIEARLGIEN
jgi:cob(I)alamin adenosyltransferase